MNKNSKENRDKLLKCSLMLSECLNRNPLAGGDVIKAGLNYFSVHKYKTLLKNLESDLKKYEKANKL